MTSSQESSKDGAPAGANCDPLMGIESLAGAFHPHAIEVQDFPYYARVIDLRPRGEYEHDHIPDAVNVEAPAEMTVGSPGAEAPLVAAEPGRAQTWPALDAAVAGVRLDEAILVYCGRGGLVSTPVARALRWRGWTTDVLPGGWVNYRRWVQAGLEVLPRLVPFSLVACALGSENARVLGALRSAGEQVLDFEALASWRRLAFTPVAAIQPTQPWFESLLLRELRAFDPRRPVWAADVSPILGALMLPGAVVDALSIAPRAELSAPAASRMEAWVADEPLCADAAELVQRVSALDPPPAPALGERWRQMLTTGAAGALLASILQEFLDPVSASDRAARGGRHHALAPLAADALAPEPLTRAAADYVRSLAPPGDPAAT
jgi:tRNA 2-selenouridine synthase